MDKRAMLEEIIKWRIPNYHKDFPIILFWSQKSGCTSLLKWFFFQIGRLEEAEAYNPWLHYYEEEVYKGPEYTEELIQSLLAKQKKTYKLVRNPYKRAVSQFLILSSIKGLPYWEREWEKIRTFFYQDKDSKRGITFKQFLIYVRDYPEAIDDHFKPQYLEREEQFVQDYIYLENFNYDIRELEKQFRLKKSNLKELSDSSHHLSNSMVLTGHFANIEIVNDTFLGDKKVPTYESFYNEETIELVHQIYRKDFEVYGYEMKGPFR